MMEMTEKYAGWCFAVAVLWSGMGEGVVDVSVLVWELAYLGRCSMPKGLCVLLALIVLHPTTGTLELLGLFSVGAC